MEMTVAGTQGKNKNSVFAMKEQRFGMGREGKQGTIS